MAAPGSGSLLGGGGEAGGSGGKGHTKGNTIYVFGYQITEELLKNTFAACGKIVNISMEVEKVSTKQPIQAFFVRNPYKSLQRKCAQAFLIDFH